MIRGVKAKRGNLTSTMIGFPEDQFEAINRLAALTGTTFSEMVRILVDRGLEPEDTFVDQKGEATIKALLTQVLNDKEGADRVYKALQDKRFLKGERTCETSLEELATDVVRK